MGLLDSFFDSFKKQPPLTSVLERMTRALGYPFRVVDPTLSPEEVVTLYAKELARGRREGYTPLILPEDEMLADYLHALTAAGFDRQVEAQRIGDDGQKRLWQRLSALESQPRPAAPETEAEAEAGETPVSDGTDSDIFLSIIDFIEYEVKPLALLKLPTLEPWKSVVYVPFGGWGHCPEPGEMGAVCRHWYEKHGAVPAVISHDSVEFLLPHPVPKDLAGDTAREHFALCPERVYQCTDSGTVEELAKSLAASRLWYFWWEDKEI